MNWIEITGMIVGIIILIAVGVYLAVYSRWVTDVPKNLYALCDYIIATKDFECTINPYDNDCMLRNNKLDLKITGEGIRLGDNNYKTFAYKRKLDKLYVNPVNEKAKQLLDIIKEGKNV